MDPHKVSFFSRRAFLKISALGLAAGLLPWVPEKALAQSDQQGRVISDLTPVYSQPSYLSERIKFYWRDNIVPIINATVGYDPSSYNRFWYQLDEEAFVHSGGIQPVQTSPTVPNKIIPSEGVLAEVCVPFTDARWWPAFDRPFAYRYYYLTTHWVVGFVEDESGETWYIIQDDKWDFKFYALARHLRFLSHEELQPISPHVHSQNKRLEVRLDEQVMFAYELNKPVYSARVATGGIFRDGNFTTPKGQYLTFHKRPSRHMAAGDLASNGYDLPGVPWVTYITEEGISFHGTFWHNDFGAPRSHGCINLTPQAAKWVYLWTQPSVPWNEQKVYGTTGTVVDVV
jgi:hypothetical protein